MQGTETTRCLPPAKCPGLANARKRPSIVLADFAFVPWTRNGTCQPWSSQSRRMVARVGFGAPPALLLFRAEIQPRVPSRHSVSSWRLLNYRFAMARDFLAEPRACVSEVACAVGFDHHSRFARTFRRLFGKPPTGYNQRVSPGQDPDEANRDSRAETSHWSADPS